MARGSTPWKTRAGQDSRCHPCFGSHTARKTLGADDYYAALRQKLQEEVAELLAAEGNEVLEEAADILEVLTAIAAEYGETLNSIVDVARRKRAERGGFDMRLRLDGVGPAPDHGSEQGGRRRG